MLKKQENKGCVNNNQTPCILSTQVKVGITLKCIAVLFFFRIPFLFID